MCGGTELLPFTLSPWTPDRLHFSQARCAGCGLVVAQPQATEEELATYYATRYYEQHPLDAETHWQENVRDYPRYELPLMERLWSGFAPRAGAEVAEIGCGHGSLLTVLNARGYKTRGVELSSAAVAFCRDKGLDVREGKDFGDEKAACDVAASFQVIEHVIDPRVFVRHMVGLTRPGGAVVITTESIWTAQFVFERAKALLRGQPSPYRTSSEHTFVFSGHHLERLLREEGCSEARSAAYRREPARGALHFRAYREAFRAIDRVVGSGEYLMAVGRKA
ncbi:SAM-dependent methyltransferase [Minicystis rosea]|nr:SAM-dependent methyltransferase [Minicystis rosea]